jgi:Tfp pilus assembly protein PilO
MTLDLPRVSAFAALLIVLSGYVLIFRPLEASIMEHYADIDTARVTLEHGLALARRIPALQHEQSSLVVQLTRLHMGDGRVATVDRFLRTVAGISSRDNVAVESVAAGMLLPPGIRARTEQKPLEELPLEITVRGQYGDVIRAVRDLNDGDAAARITLVSFGNADRRRGVRPQLNAAFHVTLLRENDDTTTSVTRRL